MQKVKPFILDKSYVPNIGDILRLRDNHPFVVIENVYFLNKRGIRVNKDYDKEYIRHLALQKIIRRKEIIWSQHKNDFDLFPETIIYRTTATRDTMTYSGYCLMQRQAEFNRLYNSKYTIAPKRKKTQITGEQMIVTATHRLCKFGIETEENEEPRDITYCSHYGATRSLPLSRYITQGYECIGNVYENQKANKN